MMTIASPRTCFGVTVRDVIVMTAIFPTLSRRMRSHLTQCEACMRAFTGARKPDFEEHDGRVTGQDMVRYIVEGVSQEKKAAIDHHLWVDNCWACGERYAELADSYTKMRQFFEIRP